MLRCFDLLSRSWSFTHGIVGFVSRHLVLFSLGGFFARLDGILEASFLLFEYNLASLLKLRRPVLGELGDLLGEHARFLIGCFSPDASLFKGFLRSMEGFLGSFC